MTDDVVIEELAPAFRVIFRPLLHSGVEGNVGGAAILRH